MEESEMKVKTQKNIFHRKKNIVDVKTISLAV